MSRAFPFPPLADSRNSMYRRDLVESTKLERSTEVSKTDPRKEKKVKKESKIERKGRKIDRKEREGKSCKSRKISDGGKKKEEEKLRHFIEKKVEDDTEQLEKSGLTDEHEQPLNLCYLSDGTQSDKKRKREDPPASQNQIGGKPPLRIRLVFRKSKESSEVLNQQPTCSTSGAESLIDHPEKVQGSDSRTDSIASTSHSVSDEKLQLNTKRISSKSHKSSESTFQSLFNNWVPQELKCQLNEEGEDDQEWLFGSKKRGKSSDVTRTETEDVCKSCEGPSWPKAQFLHNVGIYALPYTIPF